MFIESSEKRFLSLQRSDPLHIHLFTAQNVALLWSAGHGVDAVTINIRLPLEPRPFDLEWIPTLFTH
jgi:hypothetical protein